MLYAFICIDVKQNVNYYSRNNLRTWDHGIKQGNQTTSVTA